VERTIHLHPTAPLAERVLLPGDPGRALRLAQRLLHQPKMFNHNRGLWGYTGTAADGTPLSIQSTGMGAPSAAIVVTELVQLGARRLIRIGTCGALSPRLALGDLVIVTAAITADGASRALGAGERVAPTPELAEALRSVDGSMARGTVVSADLFYDASGPERDWAQAGAIAVEMETAILFTLALVHGVQAAALLAASDVLVPARRRIAPEALEVAEHRLGDVAAAALSDGPG